MSLLGVDVGTTGCKAVAFDMDGNALAQFYREYSLTHPEPGWSELDTNNLWHNVSTVLSAINEQIKSDPVKALSISSQGEAVTAIDNHGRHLCNFSVSFDHRTIPQAEWWQETFGAKRLFDITGMPLHATHTINKIMWYRQNRPEIYKKSVKFLCVEDFINFKLTGEFATDWSLAGRTMAFDVINKCWSDEILQAAKVDKELLPSVHPSGTAIGEILPEVANELGFEGKVVVATGGHDQPCGSLGAGIIAPGIAMNATGTSDTICLAFSKPILSETMLSGNYSCYPHVVSDQYVSIAFNLTGGLLLRWYGDILCDAERSRARNSNKSIYEVVIEEASEDIDSLFFLPHFVGAGTPYLDSYSRGALVGLTIATNKQNISKAVLDSINYEMKLNIELMKEAGLRIRQLRAIGGGAKSKKWLQMKADTFGLPVCSMKVSEAASLGAAILGGMGTGSFDNIQDAVESMVHMATTYEPNEEQTRLYEDKYQQYKLLYPALKDYNKLLSGAATT